MVILIGIEFLHRIMKQLGTHTKLIPHFKTKEKKICGEDFEIQKKQMGKGQQEHEEDDHVQKDTISQV